MAFAVLTAENTHQKFGERFGGKFGENIPFFSAFFGVLFGAFFLKREGVPEVCMKPLKAPRGISGL